MKEALSLNLQNYIAWTSQSNWIILSRLLRVGNGAYIQNDNFPSMHPPSIAQKRKGEMISIWPQITADIINLLLEGMFYINF